jgi:hypothetical protein
MFDQLETQSLKKWTQKDKEFIIIPTYWDEIGLGNSFESSRLDKEMNQWHSCMQKKAEVKKNLNIRVNIIH